MDYNPKSRGLKHVKNKSKYKPTKNAAETKSADGKKSKKIELESNWHRYEEEEPSQEDPLETIQRGDFAALAKAPISQGGSFQFKRDILEQNDETFSTERSESDMFQLDLNLLSLSLSTIPFYEVCDIPEHYFTEQEKEQMIQKAKNNEKAYNDYLIAKEEERKKKSKTQAKESKKPDVTIEEEVLPEISEFLRFCLAERETSIPETKTDINSGPSTSKSITTELATENQEEDLKFLKFCLAERETSIPETKTDVNSEPSTSKSLITELATQNEEEDLKFLKFCLAERETSISETKTDQNSEPSTSKNIATELATQNEEDDLESWLDDILDD